MTSSALKLATHPTHAATDWSQWVAIEEAAQVLGVTEGKLRLSCSRKLAARGHAMKASARPGDRQKWYIHRSHDTRLAPGSVGKSYQAADLRCYTRSQVSVAFKRADCVMRYRTARSTWAGKQSVWLPKLIAELREAHPKLKVSRGTLWRWYAAYQVPADLVKLIDERGGDQKSRGEKPVWDYFQSIYLDERQPTARDCWKRADQHAAASGLTWCSYKSLLRQLDQRISPEKQAMHRDPRAWRSRFAPYIEQDTERFDAGQCWVGDHRPLDLMCKIATADGEKIFRPCITAWLDWRTRRVYADLFESPNSSTILSVLRKGILDDSAMGGPSKVWVDNGKDYDSYTFHGRTKQQRRSRVTVEMDKETHQGLFALLGIEGHSSLAFNPQGKGRMERWFATVGERFDKTFPTYTGNTVVTKPEQLAEVLERGQVPTFQHVRERFLQFVAGYNANADHGVEDLVDSDGTRLSPDEAMARWCPHRRVMADPAALELCLMQFHRPVPVGRNGVSINVAGQTMRYGQYNPQLGKLKGTGRKVHVAYDPQAMNTVKVYDERWAFITEAEWNQTCGAHADPVSHEHVREQARAKNAYKRSLKATREGYQHEYLSDEEMIADRAVQAADRALAEPRAVGMKVVQTPLDGQSKRLQRGQLRKAAGAESQTPDDGPVGRSLQPLSRLAEMGYGEFTPDNDHEAALPSFSELPEGFAAQAAETEPHDALTPWGGVIGHGGAA